MMNKPPFISSFGRHFLFVVSASALTLELRLSAATTTNVTWSGGGGAANPYWSVNANWLDGEAPANPTPANIVYSTYGQSITGVVDADWQVGGIQIGSSNVATTNFLDLGGHTLTVTNRIRIISGYGGRANTFVVSNGTVRLGADSSPAWMEVLPPGNLWFASGTRLEAYNVQCITAAPNAYYNSSIDLRGVEVVGGTLGALQLVLGSPWSSWFGSRLFMEQQYGFEDDFHKQPVQPGQGQCQ